MNKQVLLWFRFITVEFVGKHRESPFHIYLCPCNIYLDAWYKKVNSSELLYTERFYEYNTFLLNGLCNILCILTSSGPLHLMVQAQNGKGFHEQDSTGRAVTFLKIQGSARAILLLFIWVLLQCRIYCANTKYMV